MCIHPRNLEEAHRDEMTFAMHQRSKEDAFESVFLLLHSGKLSQVNFYFP